MSMCSSSSFSLTRSLTFRAVSVSICLLDAFRKRTRHINESCLAQELRELENIQAAPSRSAEAHGDSHRELRRPGPDLLIFRRTAVIYIYIYIYVYTYISRLSGVGSNLVAAHWHAPN